MRDVAEHCRLSPATVSLVLSGQTGRFTPETRARVLSAVEELGYQPNALASSLRTNRTRTIGVIADRIITTPYATEMIDGVQTACWERGYLPFVVAVDVDVDPRRSEEAIEALVARRVDGLLVGAMYHRRVPIEPTMHGLAAVGMNVRPAQQGADQTGAACFVPDETAAAETAVATLLGLGHRRIVHISEAPTAGVASALRVDGYQRAIAAAGLGDEGVVVRTNHGESASDGAERLSHHLLTSSRRPTAIFAYNDHMAIGIYRTARRLGIEIPTGLSVIGFDDQVLISTELRPTLTTMALPHYDMGNLAAVALLERIAQRSDGNPAQGITLVECPLRRRDSIGPLPPEADGPS